MTDPLQVERRQGERRRGGDRRRDRQPLSPDEDTSALSLKLLASTHDRLVQTAARREELVSETLRRLLEFALTAEALLCVSHKSDVR